MSQQQKFLWFRSGSYCGLFFSFSEEAVPLGWYYYMACKLFDNSIIIIEKQRPEEKREKEQELKLSLSHFFFSRISTCISPSVCTVSNQYCCAKVALILLESLQQDVLLKRVISRWGLATPAGRDGQLPCWGARQR